MEGSSVLLFLGGTAAVVASNEVNSAPEASLASSVSAVLTINMGAAGSEARLISIIGPSDGPSIPQSLSSIHLAGPSSRND